MPEHFAVEWKEFISAAVQKAVTDPEYQEIERFFVYTTHALAVIPRGPHNPPIQETNELSYLLTYYNPKAILSIRTDSFDKFLDDGNIEKQFAYYIDVQILEKPAGIKKVVPLILTKTEAALVLISLSILFYCLYFMVPIK